MPQFAHPWPRASCSARALKRSVFRVTVLERVMDFSFSSTPSEIQKILFCLAFLDTEMFVVTQKDVEVILLGLVLVYQKVKQLSGNSSAAFCRSQSWVTTSSTSIQDMPGDDCGRLEYAP
ncbi:hypothetical protein CDAR_588681 [Caerostris darwini]|uniref:Uncharacterized protein n=1 Tax=Caerostris darwini TaxID=1538125 RepID=A0AAV4UV93_9ARAC|nr:hypothetical protein CDAR_588681 [Caerostris darwini]